MKYVLNENCGNDVRIAIPVVHITKVMGFVDSIIISRLFSIKCKNVFFFKKLVRLIFMHSK